MPARLTFTAFAIALLLSASGCDETSVPDDASLSDAGRIDGGRIDGGRIDDAGPRDAGDIDASATDASSCSGTETLCDGSCVTTATDPDHCGGCGDACGIGQACDGSGCVDETPATEGDLTVEVVATDLEVVWEIRFLPDGDMLITERPGRVSRVAIADGTVTVLGTLPVAARGEGGLMGLALDPAFETDPRIYVCYTYDNGGGPRNRVSRLDFAPTAVTGEVTLLDGIPGASNHNGCRLGFGPDDMLYVTMGDAATGTNAQDMDSLSGKVLRMDRDGAIPADNPFADSYVYTLGHRNPQGLDWDRSGVAFVSEHGPNIDDEVNRLVAGRNYGWPMFSGDPSEPGFEDSIYSWTPTVAPAGAVFYYGGRIPGWRGSYLMLTLKEADIRRLTPADEMFTAVASEETLLDNDYGRLRAIRVGPDGWIYVGTSARDGRGSPTADDDRILRIRM